MSRMSSRARRREPPAERLNLHAEWCTGARILAGTAFCPPPPPPRNFWKECRNLRCGTIVRGVDEAEAFGRLTEHMSKCMFGTKVKRRAA